MIRTIIEILDLLIKENWFVYNTKICYLYWEKIIFFLQVNPRFAIDFVRDDPVVVCRARGVWSDSGGPLGHPKVYINLVRYKTESFLSV
jgi:hypothetical protein